MPDLAVSPDATGLSPGPPPHRRGPLRTLFLLAAQYDGRAVIPLDAVCRDYFTHLKPDHMIRKAMTGELALPILRMEDGLKAAKGVYLEDLAAYLDARAEQARREMHQSR